MVSSKRGFTSIAELRNKQQEARPFSCQGFSLFACREQGRSSWRGVRFGNERRGDGGVVHKGLRGLEVSETTDLSTHKGWTSKIGESLGAAGGHAPCFLLQVFVFPLVLMSLFFLAG